MSQFEWVAAALIGIISVARTIRLLIFDELPPMKWLRAHIIARYAEDSDWSKLWTCPFCMAPYLSVGMFVWAWLAYEDGSIHWSWWVVNGIWAASYLAAIVVAYDQPEE